MYRLSLSVLVLLSTLVSATPPSTDEAHNQSVFDSLTDQNRTNLNFQTFQTLTKHFSFTLGMKPSEGAPWIYRLVKKQGIDGSDILVYEPLKFTNSSKDEEQLLVQRKFRSKSRRVANNNGTEVFEYDVATLQMKISHEQNPTGKDQYKIISVNSRVETNRYEMGYE